MGGSYKAGAVRNRASEKGRSRGEWSRASEKERSRGDGSRASEKGRSRGEGSRASEKGRSRGEGSRASEKGRSRAGEQRKTGWKAATKAAAKEGIDVTKKANILCQEEEQQERGGNKQKEEQRKCNSAFGCGKIFCDQCYPPGDALGRRG